VDYKTRLGNLIFLGISNGKEKQSPLNHSENTEGKTLGKIDVA